MKRLKPKPKKWNDGSTKRLKVLVYFRFIEWFNSILLDSIHKTKLLREISVKQTLWIHPVYSYKIRYKGLSYTNQMQGFIGCIEIILWRIAHGWQTNSTQAYNMW